uniref:ANK_REP_REGION domain-containing protein n=1 Tax=Anopheles stephensi TaxID=30069 RepID=A0A182YCD1_ANOST
MQENTTRTPLHEAAAGGDETKVETLLAAGADRNAKESVHGNTPLHEAAWKGYSRCVKLLCALPKTKPPASSKGISIDLLKDATKIKHALHDTKGALHSALLGTRNFGGFSALHLAAQNGHNQSCREILLAGADPDVQNNYGDTPLHTACRYGHAGAIRILLSAKCDFERINLNGDTALHIACAMGRRKLTRILLEAGCRQDTKNAQDETARDIAQRKNLVEIINILNTPVDLSARRSRERSSSSSQHQRNKPDGVVVNGGTHHKPSPHEHAAERRSRSKDEVTRKSGRRSNSNDDAAAAAATRADAIDPKHWSPYGCHYFPDPRNFPSPKLETLPKEPLGNGEQYFLDLAGNIRKGPVGVGNTCYCAPFFKHLEQRMNQNRRSIRKYVHRATEKLDSRMTALAMRTDDQIEELTKSMIASRVQCENKRLHLEQWLKRGIAERSTTTATSGGLEHSNSKTKKDEANTNTLTRCRSLELLDDHDAMLLASGVDAIDDQLRKSSTPTRALFSRSIDFLDAATNGDSDHGLRLHRQQQHQQQQQELESHLRLLQYAAAGGGGGAGGHTSDALESSNNSNMKNHSESAETPPIPDGTSIRISRRPRSSSMSGRDSYSYSSDNNKDNDREKPPPRLANGGHDPMKLIKKRSLPPTSSTPTSAISSNGGTGAVTSAKSEKAKVTERLEELLSKTKKILELEKMTKAAGGGGAGSPSGLVSSPLIGIHPSAASTPTTDNRYILALDKLRDIHHYEPSAGGPKPSGRSARDSPGYDIAQEMEKITKSLLPAAPVSPEIAKDITTRKERPTTVLYASYQQPLHHPHRRTTPQESSPLSTTPLSTMSPSSSLLGGQTAPSRSSPFASDRQHLASTNFMEDSPCDEQSVTAAMGGCLMNGFYSNSCFEDAPPSSSNTTIKSAGPRRQPEAEDSELEQDEQDGAEEEEEEEDEEHEQEDTKEQEDEGDDQDEEDASDLSDRCDLSAMANLAELKELKSRILNGTNWRSQVLQKSVQELLRNGEGGTDAISGSQEQDPSHALAETNRVKYIISKLQQTGVSAGSDVAIRTQHQVPPMARCEDFSDSSSEEDEDEVAEDVHGHHVHEDEDEDCVDGPPIPVHGEQDKPREIGIGTAKSLIQLYEQSSSCTSANGAIGKPVANGPFASIPKDAYFHELPARKLLPPAPELNSISGLTSRVHQTARSRNPLPSYLLQEGAGELFQQQSPDILDQQGPASGGYAQQPGYFDELSFQSHHPIPQLRTPPTMSSYPIPADGFLPPVGLPNPVNHHHHPHGHIHLQQQQQQQQQQQEKLLSTRKYINPSSAVSLASTGTPSPEFPLYHHPHQQQLAGPPSTAQPTYPSAGTASVIGGHSHAMMTMMAAGRKSVDQLSSNGEDAGYVSEKVSEIHIPSGGASPLLSATASANVLIIPPPAASSPKHFLPYSHHHHPLVTSMHQRNGATPSHHGSVVTSIVPPPAGSSASVAAGIHPTAGQTTAQLHAAVEQKQQALYKLGASSLV